MMNLHDPFPFLYEQSIYEDLPFETLVPLMERLTYRLEAEKERGDSQVAFLHFFKTLMEKSESNVGLLDSESSLVCISSGLRHYQRQDPSLQISSFFPEMPEAMRESIETTLRGEKGDTQQILIKGDQDRSPLWIQWRAYPWPLGEGKRGVLFFFEDITQEKELYLEVCRLSARVELMEKCALILCHDLMQPLRHMSHTLTFLEKDRTPLSSDQTSAFLSFHRHLSKAREICEGVLSYCRQGDMRQNQESVRLSEVMALVLDPFQGNSDILIDTSLPQDTFVKMSRVCVIQLFQNLIANAIQHSQEFPIRIHIGGSVSKENPSFYQVTIRNNTACPEHLDQTKVFDFLYSQGGEGSGLGLSICQKIVESYGGTIHFFSTPQEGTCVSFSLPLSPKNS